MRRTRGTPEEVALIKPVVTSVPPTFLKTIKKSGEDVKSAATSSFKNIRDALKPKQQPKFLQYADQKSWQTLPGFSNPSTEVVDSNKTEGRFMTHRRSSVGPLKTIAQQSGLKREYSTKGKGALGRQASARKASSFGSSTGRHNSTVSSNSILTPTSGNESKLSAERRFWDAMDTHHVLPVFAAGKAYVPASFESLLVQSFYSVLTPIICDKLVCGQKHQTVMHCKMPKKLVGRKFQDVYRLFMQYHVCLFDTLFFLNRFTIIFIIVGFMLWCISEPASSIKS